MFTVLTPSFLLRPGHLAFAVGLGGEAGLLTTVAQSRHNKLFVSEYCTILNFMIGIIKGRCKLYLFLTLLTNI